MENHVLEVCNLKTENLTNPLAVRLLPRFSWSVISKDKNQSQGAYRIIVSDDFDNLLWDSGKVKSTKNFAIKYQGNQLENGKKYKWSVTVYNKNGKKFKSEQIATFETCLSEEFWNKAKWISAKTIGAPIFRKSIVLQKKDILRARIYICGLGLFNLYLNGEKVSEDLLQPATTQFDKRYFYLTYDVKEHLKNEVNVIGAILGRGFYSTLSNKIDWQTENWAKANWADERKLKLICKIDYIDGTTDIISTDESWKTCESPIVFDNPYFGEKHDARKEISNWCSPTLNDENWHFAKISTSPLGKLEPSNIEPIKTCQTIMPISVKQLDKSVYLVDVGKTISGWLQVTLKGKSGSTVKVEYSERIKDDGKIDREWLINDLNYQGETYESQTDYFVLKGENEERFEPIFTFKSFKYVQITIENGTELINTVAKSVYTNLLKTGEFYSSHESINKIHSACVQSLLNNFHGYPSDTPVYENLGYLADGFVTQNTASYNFFSANFYEKWARDIQLQTKANGYLEQTAPMWDEDKENAPEWSLAIIFVPWQHYYFYGDEQILKDNFAEMQKVFSYQLSLSKNYKFRSMWGDHGGKLLDLSPTVCMYFASKLLAKISKILGVKKVNYYNKIATNIKKAFEKEFFNSKQGYYCEKDGEFHLNAQILPIAFNMVSKKRKNSLFRLIEEKIPSLCTLDCGIISIKYLFNILAENLNIETALDMVLNPKFKNYGYLLQNGATTLWECFNTKTRSFNHHMFASVDEFLYNKLAGINGVDVAFSKLYFKPYLTNRLTWCKASIQTVKGKIESSWANERSKFTYKITVPQNVTAQVCLPFNGKYQVFDNLNNPLKIKSVKKEGNTIFSVKQGTYKFVYIK